MTLRQVCCVDVGGSSLKVGTLDADAHFTGLDQVPTPGLRSADGREVLELVAKTIVEVGAAHRLAGVGVVVPGIVDADRGTAVWSANLGWHDVPFRQELGQAVELPVTLGHDVRAGALAETRLGAACGERDTAFLAVGTGVAAGIVVGGRPVDGGGWAGEVGHMDLGHEERCNCGRVGCLEAIASAGAIARRYAARAGRPVTEAEEVARLARAGDPAAATVWSDAVDALGRSIAWMTGLFAPQVVVIGGGLAAAGEQLLAPLRVGVASRLGSLPSPRIVQGRLGLWAGCIGGGLLAFDTLADGSEGHR